MRITLSNDLFSNKKKRWVCFLVSVASLVVFWLVGLKWLKILINLIFSFPDEQCLLSTYDGIVPHFSGFSFIYYGMKYPDLSLKYKSLDSFLQKYITNAEKYILKEVDNFDHELSATAIDEL
eukprot:Pgem_evm1s9250